MRHSIPLPSGRAAAWVCAVCRNEAPTTRRALFSTATSHSHRTTLRPTTTTPRGSLPATRRWLSPTATTTPPQTAQDQQEPQQQPQPPNQALKPLPYYTLFPLTLPHGPPPQGPFEIHIPTLRREFLRLQSRSHPDLHHHHNSTRLESQAASSEINAAFKTLCSPLLRAEYILREQYGVDLAADESTGPGEDPEVLMAVLEAREAIDAAREEGELEGVRAENEGRVREAERRIGEALGRGDVEGARRECVRLRYWLGVREGVEGWEAGKGGGAATALKMGEVGGGGVVGGR